MKKGNKKTFSLKHICIYICLLNVSRIIILADSKASPGGEGGLWRKYSQILNFHFREICCYSDRDQFQHPTHLPFSQRWGDEREPDSME